MDQISFINLFCMKKLILIVVSMLLLLINSFDSQTRKRK